MLLIPEPKDGFDGEFLEVRGLHRKKEVSDFLCHVSRLGRA